MLGFNPGVIVDGMEKGYDRQEKQAQAKRDIETHNMDMRTKDNANYEMDLVRNMLEEQKATADTRWKSQITTARDEAVSNYMMNIDPKTFMHDKFGGKIEILQKFSRLWKPNEQPPVPPNPHDPSQIQQMTQLVQQENPDLTPDEIKMAVHTNMTSGEYIATADGKVVPVDKIFGVLGAKPSADATERFNQFLAAKQKLSAAKSTKTTSDEQEEIDAYDEYIRIKDKIANLKDNGAPVPEILYRALNKASLRYRSGGGKAAAKEEISAQERIAYARLHPQYEGEADDLRHFHDIQLKDKDKVFAKIQADVEKSRRFQATEKRVYSILDQAGKSFTRDALSNALHKASQHFEGGLDGLKKMLTSKSAVDRMKAQEAFDRIETAIGYPMVMLIKEISGAAVTDEERSYLMNLVIGGDWKNLNALKAKLDEFNNTLVDEANRGLDRKVSGGFALRPNWAKMVKEELNNSKSSGKLGKVVDISDAQKQDDKDDAEANGDTGSFLDKTKNAAGDIWNGAKSLFGFGDEAKDEDYDLPYHKSNLSWVKDPKQIAEKFGPEDMEALKQFKEGEEFTHDQTHTRWRIHNGQLEYLGEAQ